MSSNLSEFLINRMNPELLPLGGATRRKYTVAAHSKGEEKRNNHWFAATEKPGFNSILPPHVFIRTARTEDLES